MENQCVILRKRFDQKNIDMALPNIHPRIEVPKDDSIMISVQEDDILKVAFFNGAPSRFDVHNPTRRNFTGMPARFISLESDTGRVNDDGVSRGVMFADGTILKAYLPPDAKPIGSSEWPYEMRWRRVYKNYYHVTRYRGADTVVSEALMTEENGRDLTEALGESSATHKVAKNFAAGSGDRVNIYQGFSKKTQHDFLTLIYVYEKDIPPNFPKGLVRWIP
ncbi:hypothetical protein [Desulfovibrio litoralis]|uniref:Uncharacterized protein n=1 Tax=Desulfovibrio litoralis DSM 11393 TaxID=1121455 RepID=A0A1M7TLD5_9BACT|nr:hypothetical protein [Desulfovibrio litoralis]SHN71542.1 hypothetical protein SAMN02745728_02205 [Desulfovibrio litoralis DSM 11393]